MNVRRCPSKIDRHLSVNEATPTCRCCDVAGDNCVSVEKQHQLHSEYSVGGGDDSYYTSVSSAFFENVLLPAAALARYRSLPINVTAYLFTVLQYAVSYT